MVGELGKVVGGKQGHYWLGLPVVYIGIVLALSADGGLPAVSGIDGSIIRQYHQSCLDAFY